MGHWVEYEVFIGHTCLLDFDYIAMKKLLEYDGEIHMICRWAQELLGYHYSIIHRCARMMRDIDVISRRFGPSIGLHIRTASLLASFDREKQPSAYTATVPPPTTEAVCSSSQLHELLIPVLTKYALINFTSIDQTTPVVFPCASISSAPVLL